ncbi:nucleotidyltransferase domain-containing protein [Paenibacillus sp. FSL H7-0442]|uniref:nucleotidyltransferase domain-containing protein n=1 Tax=Paenibacillus sp. FSL H7-0442 TaxID=2921435 RepID=UPI0031595EC3
MTDMKHGQGFIQPEMRETILRELRALEQAEQVRIVYACESGSRAWGFPSQDSDYDVRFIYVRPIEWYLSIFDKRDVIERPISDLLDINGWDLKKALQLFRKSNPPLLEWLQSPISYLEQYAVADQIRAISPLTFSPKSCMYHYLNMARGNYRDYLQGEQVKIKKYFYVLRPLLACSWIERHNSMPPMEFVELLEELIPAHTELYQVIEHLLDHKKAGEELDVEPQLSVVNDFIQQQIAYFEQKAPLLQHMESGRDQQLDDMFRAAVNEVWKV